MKIETQTATRQGKRNRNEDHVAVDDDLGVAILCDGMGGHPYGAFAARTAGDTALTLLRRKKQDIERCSSSDCPSHCLEDLLASALEATNRRLNRLTDEEEKGLRPGSTITAVLVRDDRAVLAWLGDSPAYLLRGGRLQQLTQPHTLGQELLDLGALSEEEVERTPWSHTLTRACGIDEQVTADVRTIRVRPGDRIVLVSDGTSNPLGREGMEELLVSARDDLADLLVRKALDQGGRDDATTIVVDVLSHGTMDETEDGWSRHAQVSLTG